MAINLRAARALCTARELELVAAATGERLAALSAARLQGKIARARALRDKYRDLLRRQQLALRGRSAGRADAARANARTAAKAKLFGETLARFSARLAQLQAAAKRRAPKAKTKVAVRGSVKADRAQAAATAGTRSPKAPARPMPSPKAPAPAVRGFVSEKAAQAARRLRLQSMGAKGVQAHVSARGRRRQAKRDARPRH
jgi:hypothetical protein